MMLNSDAIASRDRSDLCWKMRDTPPQLSCPALSGASGIPETAVLKLTSRGVPDRPGPAFAKASAGHAFKGAPEPWRRRQAGR
jgi:hypothetical protein